MNFLRTINDCIKDTWKGSGLTLITGIYFCMFLNAEHLVAQPLYFENYTSEQGLSQNSCYSIAQDDLGFMWFGTQDGLNRYDGREFRVYLKQQAGDRLLPANHVSSLFFDDREKLLWVGTTRGVCLYNRRGDSLQRISAVYPFAAMLDTMPVKKIVSFEPNEYWIITPRKGLLHLNLQTRTSAYYFDDVTNRESVTSIVRYRGEVVMSLLHSLYILKPSENRYIPVRKCANTVFTQINQLYAHNDLLWIGTLSSNCYYMSQSMDDEKNIHLIKTMPGGINVFLQEDNGRIWAGSRGSGIYRYHIKEATVQRVAKNPYDPGSLATDFILDAYKDKQGITWFGLSGGIAKYDPMRQQFGYLGEMGWPQKALPEKSVYMMYKARNGRLYIGTQSHGILEWNRSAGTITAITQPATINGVNSMVYNITENTDGHIWAATVSGPMEYNPHTGKVRFYQDNGLIALNRTVALLKLKQANNMLVATENGLWYFFPASGRWSQQLELAHAGAQITTPVYTPRYMYEDEDNTVWICTEGAGLLQYSYPGNRLKPVTPVNHISLFVRHLLKDGNLLWLATDDGVIVYDYRQQKIIHHLVPETRNRSSVCYAVLKDDDGFYWVSTNFGLYKVDAAYKVRQHYDISNGLRFLEYNTAAAFKDTDGMLYFGGMGGITFFQPAALKSNNFSPRPMVTGMVVNGSPRSVLEGRPLQLQHNENFITFQFAVTNYSNEKNNRFSYRLKGLTDNWSPFATGNVADFTSLPPGDYVFELKSANSDGKGGDDISTMPFTIRTPWWQQWWFIVVVLCLLTGIAAWVIRRRIRVIKKEAGLKQQIAEAEMMAMRAQMNPHFVFNSLNSIREMILSNENKEASHFLGKFAGLIRITLDQSGVPFVTLRQTMDHLTRYIEMEQIRNGEFTCRILADDDLDPDEVMLPSMLIQPFVENALWHGTTATRKNINIRIDFKKQATQLLCVVEDDGIGIRQSLKNKANGSKTHHSVGIENITNRIRLLNEKYALRCSVHIDDKAALDSYTGTGTVVQLLLPHQINRS
ncbi:two-component regulator propeller domain-containing protein [Niabella sp.]|uniref:ligand-binding sensor domain-containing protein n=1 Tax=Niabella sp. TaxID=1962976 RepID=UPI00260A0F6E|nr:two-component regulator propeller domain-containing protein [Niabella sp.]